MGSLEAFTVSTSLHLTDLIGAVCLILNAKCARFGEAADALRNHLFTHSIKPRIP